MAGGASPRNNDGAMRAPAGAKELKTFRPVRALFISIQSGGLRPRLIWSDRSSIVTKNCFGRSVAAIFYASYPSCLSQRKEQGIEFGNSDDNQSDIRGFAHDN